jgi:large repetitive protein
MKPRTLALLVGIMLTQVGDAMATTRTVSTTNDAGAGSLRQTIADAASGDTINFAVSGTITLTNGELSVCGKNLTIVGSGATNLTISGNNLSRVFGVCTNTTLNLSALAIANGHSTNGGGIYNSGFLHVSHCMFFRNQAVGVPDYSGGPACGGAIYNDANAGCELTSSTLVGNTANGGWAEGDSYAIGGLAEGGGIWSAGQLHLHNVTLFNNIAQGGNARIPGMGEWIFTKGGDANGGGICSRGTTTLTNCTLQSDAAYAGMGGYTAPFGGIYVLNPGASDAGGISVQTGVLILKNAALNGGIPNDLSSYVTLVDAGNNVSSSSGALTNSTSHTGTNVLLGPLGYYGGPTPTVPLLYGSPALNAGDTAAAPPTDQRGYPRSGPADIGAYEWGAAPPTPPQFTECSNLTNAMALEFTGEIGRVFEIHASTNLTSWTWLATVTNQTGQILYTDPQATNYPMRFYRAIQLP